MAVITGAMIMKALGTVGSKMVGLVPALLKMPKQRREQVAVYCEQIAKCLTTAYMEFNEGKIPHGSCGEMCGYLNDLGGVLTTAGKVVTPTEVEQLKREFEAAHEVEQLGLKVRQPFTGRDFPVLATTAGRFLAVANKIRALN